jgi:threonine efflux protein
MMATLITIAVLHWAVLLVPGFNFLLIGQLAAGDRRAAALAAVAGMTSATLVWAGLAVAGVGLVFQAHPVLRLAMQGAGGLYLAWVAIGLWRSGQQPASAASSSGLSSAAAFRVGFLTSALNPKIALFYGSVFATALPAQPPAALVAAAVALVYANSVLWHGFLAWALSRPGVQQAWLRHHARWTRAAAALVGVFAARLLAAGWQELRGRGG